MLILALETATRAGSLALVGPAARHAQAGDVSRTHGARLPAELLEFVAQQGRRITEIDRLCVVTGPGSFTGLRIGLATIQGVAMTTGIPVIGIPTLDAMAAAWFDQHRTVKSRLVTCLDGARGDVFYEVFDRPRNAALIGRPLLDAAVATPFEAASRIAELDGEENLVIAGDGGARYREALAAGLPRATFDTQPLNLALGAALLATERAAQSGPPHALRPLYVRRPDAVLARERARSQSFGREVTVSRSTQVEDLNAIAELQRRSFANAWGAESIRWELDNSDVARMYAAKSQEGVVVAYCACWIVFDELHINSVAVDEEWRRAGVARSLLESVLGEAAASGVRSATLEVRQSNEAARRLYEGLGFRVEGIRRNYYQNPKEDALILWHRNLPGRFGGADA